MNNSSFQLQVVLTQNEEVYNPMNIGIVSLMGVEKNSVKWK